MSKIFPKIDIKFYSNVIILQLTTKLMNIFIISLQHIIIVGPRGLQPGPNSIWAQSPCRGGILPRTNGQWPRWQGERLRTYPILGIPELQ